MQICVAFGEWKILWINCAECDCLLCVGYPHVELSFRQVHVPKCWGNVSNDRWLLSVTDSVVLSLVKRRGLITRKMYVRRVCMICHRNHSQLLSTSALHNILFAKWVTVMFTDIDYATHAYLSTVLAKQSVGTNLVVNYLSNEFTKLFNNIALKNTKSLTNCKRSIGFNFR